MLRPVLAMGNSRALQRLPGFEDLDFRYLLRAMIRAAGFRVSRAFQGILLPARGFRHGYRVLAPTTPYFQLS